MRLMKYAERLLTEQHFILLILGLPFAAKNVLILAVVKDSMSLRMNLVRLY